jgi:hypothetical protein
MSKTTTGILATATNVLAGLRSDAERDRKTLQSKHQREAAITELLTFIQARENELLLFEKMDEGFRSNVAVPKLQATLAKARRDLGNESVSWEPGSRFVECAAVITAAEWLLENATSVADVARQAREQGTRAALEEAHAKLATLLES